MPDEKKYDDKIMQGLLRHPKVRVHVIKMTRAELQMYKDLLVSQGTYDRYVREREQEKNG